MCLGNDTSREIFADNFARNRGENFVQLNSKKWLCHFFDYNISIFPWMSLPTASANQPMEGMRTRSLP